MSEYAGQQFVGIDLHRRRSVIVRTTESGEVLESVRILNDVESLDRVIERAGEDPEVVLEATYGWYWAVDARREAGARVHLAHPLGVKAFEYRRVKNDFRDAADLADLLRMGRLPEAWIAPPATRELRELVRHRAKLVALRSHCKAEIHADRVAAAADGRSGLRDRGVHQCGPGSPRCRSRIPRGAADPGHRPDPGGSVRRRGRRRHPVHHAPQLACWAGLTPKHHESDTHVRRGRITKQGSRLVRWAAVESVKRVGPHTRIGALRDQVAERRGGNIGAVAAARQQVEYVFYALRDGHVRALDHPHREAA